MKKKDTEIEVKPPNVPDDTKRRILKFFMSTSIPRILSEMREKERLENNERHDE